MRRRRSAKSDRAEGAARLLAAFVVVHLAAAPALAADAWFLMGRHGECAPVSMLERKFPDMGTIEDPGAFVRFAAAKGLKIESLSVAGAGGSAVEVRLPEQRMTLLLVPGERCREHLPARRTPGAEAR